MVKLNALCSLDAEVCYRAIRRLATGKKWSKPAHDEEDDDDEDDSEIVWATNELNEKRKRKKRKKRFFRKDETLDAVKQNVGEALAMAELSLMATSAYADSSSSRRSPRKKRLRHYGHFKFTKDARTEKEPKDDDDDGHCWRHSRGRTSDRDACRDRVYRARSFQVRRSTSHEDMGRTNARTSDVHGRDIRRSSSERVRPNFNSLPRSSSTGGAQYPVEKRLDNVNRRSKDLRTSMPDGWTKRPDEETIVTDPDTGIKYKRGKLLGKGGFAKCFEFSDVKTKEKFAVKVVSKRRMSHPRTREKIKREIEIHRQLEHPNVVTFYGFFESKGAAFLILENCVQRSMVHVLAKRKTLTEAEVRYYMLQLISGCRYIHGRKIIHRDLKLGNMLLDHQMKVKIADFGLATKVLNGEKKTSLCGTPNYIAPEVLQKLGHSYEADIWALGCVMYTMLCGQPPFETTSLKETYHRIIKSKFTTPGHVTQAAAQLISKMLSVEPTSRPKLTRISTDKFFLCGHTPKTLSTLCCHTEPRFPLTSALERNRTLNGIDDKTSKPEVLQTRITQTKQTEQRCSKVHEKQQHESNENKKPTTATTVSNHKTTEIDNALRTIAESESNIRTLEKTFKIIEIKDRVRSLEQQNILDKMAITDDYSLFQHNQSQHTSNDTKVGELFEASFEPLFQLMRQAVKQNETEEFGAPCVPTSFPSSSSPSSSSSSLGSLSSTQSPTWIVKWVDYSNKYGFGYQLSDGRVGILFSDCGHILLSQDRKSVNYTGRLNKSRSFAVENVPSKLQRKLLVVQNLAEYMTKHLVRGGDVGRTAEAIGGRSNGEEPVKGSTADTVLLQKWNRDENVILMQLSNGTLQVNSFKDHSKIILSQSSLNTGDYLLTYVCRGRPTVVWPLVKGDRTKMDAEVIEGIRLALDLIDQAEETTSETNKRTDKYGSKLTSPRLKNKFKPSTDDVKS